MNKVAFRALSILPCTLIFYNGLIQLCFFIIISILFFTYINYDIALLEDVSSKSKEILYLFVYLPFNIMRNLYLIRVIDKFSAQHMAFLRVLESLSIFAFTEIKRKEKRESKLYYILQLIGFLILCFASLMHNELIIINNTKLKAKTEYYLDKDADKEQNNSDYSDTLLSDSKENSCCSNINDDLTGSDIS